MINKADFLSPELPGKHRIPSIDYFRTFAIVLVILMHTNPLSGAFGSYIAGSGSSLIEASIEFGLGRMMAIAIPFLFLVAGFFFGQKFLSCASPVKTLGTYLRRLMIAWFFWRAFYYLIPTPYEIEKISQEGFLKHLSILYDRISAGLFDFLIAQAPGHLWFMPALILALCIVAFISSINKQGLALFFFISLYVFCLATNTYASSPIGINANGFLIMYLPLDYCYAVVFVYTGWYLAVNKILLELKYSVGLIVLGVLISYLEVLFLWKQIGIRSGYTLGTLPLAIGLMMYALSMPNIGSDSVASKFGRYGLGIYFIHYFFLFWTDPINRQFGYPLADIAQPLIVYVFSLLAAIALSKSKWLRPVVV